jgi:hypothetical protein
MGYLRSVAGLDTTGCKLDSSVVFYLDRSVLADDDEASPNGNSLSGQNGAVAFATTHWSMVLMAQGDANSNSNSNSKPHTDAHRKSDARGAGHQPPDAYASSDR